MFFYILLAAFLAWAVLSPLYPPKAPPTPEEIEATRLKLEAFNQASSDFLWPFAVCVFLFLGACFVLKRIRP